MDPTRLMTLPATITPRVAELESADYDDEIEVDGTPFATKCWLEQVQRGEDTGPENVTVESWRVYLPPVAVTARDKIDVEGFGSFEFDGPVADYENPRDHRHHLEGIVRRVA